tara:strand:- start:49 stop:549 length:501 start_codon:yes stop_codon:yes gene_type:complete
MANENKTAFDILDEDSSEQISFGQRFGVIAVTRSMEVDGKTYCAVKFRGGFSTNEQAQEHASTCSKLDNRFDIFVCPLGKWLMLPPDLTMISDQKHQDEMLTNIMTNHNDKQEIERMNFEKRKKDLMDGSVTPEGTLIDKASSSSNNGETIETGLDDQQPHPKLSD